MTGQPFFVVTSEETAATVLDRFNGFHDGFMQRIVLTSQDRIEEDRSQTCTGVFDVEIDFAHYNYAKGSEPFHPHDQIVRAQFRNAQEILADFRDGFLGNTIINLSIVPVQRRRCGETLSQRCLGLRLERHYYVEEERRYELRACQLLTFTDALFLELPSAEREVAPAPDGRPETC